MSRFALLLLSSALVLVIAACDTNGDDDTVDDQTNESNGTTELPADDTGNGDDDDVSESEDDDTVASDDEDSESDTDQDVAEPDEEESTDGEDESDVDDESAVGDDDEEATPDPDDLQPDPAEGMFFDLSVEEANEMTEFEVREPQHVPENLEFQTIMGMASMEASEEEMDDEAATITFAYQQPSEDETTPGLPVEFMQSTEIDMSEGLGPDAEVEEITVDDRTISRITMTAQGDEINAWVWEEDGVFFSLAAILGEDLSEDDIEEMIASIPAA